MGSLLRGAYLALLAWQVCWHALLPPPAGSQLPWLAALAVVPLLLPLRGVLALKPRSLTWASYLLLPYFLIGVTEAWALADQRPAALAQVALASSCWVLIGLLNRRRARQAAD